MDGMPPWMLLDELAAALTGAPTEQLEQFDGDGWHESERIFAPTLESDLNAHLAFTLVPNSWRPISEQIPGELNFDALDLSVLFTYRLRPDREQGDMRLALRAADEICRVVGRQAWTHAAVQVVTVEKARLGAVPGEPYVLVESRFTLTFNPGD